MQIRQAQFFEVRNLRANAVEIAREQIDVAHAAQLLIRLKPLWVGLAFGVQGVQFRRAFQRRARGRGDDRFEMIEEIVLIAVEIKQQLKQARKMFA